MISVTYSLRLALLARALVASHRRQYGFRPSGLEARRPNAERGRVSWHWRQSFPECLRLQARRSIAAAVSSVSIVGIHHQPPSSAITTSWRDCGLTMIDDGLATRRTPGEALALTTASLW